MPVRPGVSRHREILNKNVINQLFILKQRLPPRTRACMLASNRLAQRRRFQNKVLP
jgi:hypothetical protein